MGPIYPIYNPNQASSVDRKIIPPKQHGSNSFKEILGKVSNSADLIELSFSKHALKRSQQRGINFSRDELVRISEAIDTMQKKGTREALLLYRDIALLVNVRDKKVITCVDRERLKQDVFTNIDGVMIVE